MQGTQESFKKERNLESRKGKTFINDGHCEK